jgi:hypothetical protein
MEVILLEFITSDPEDDETTLLICPEDSTGMCEEVISERELFLVNPSFLPSAFRIFMMRTFFNTPATRSMPMLLNTEVKEAACTGCIQGLLMMRSRANKKKRTSM